MTHTTDKPARIVITGAAGALGRAVAEHFLKNDPDVRLALIGHGAERLASSFPGMDISRHVLVDADVTSTADMKRAASQIVQVFQHVDAVIHIAGGFEMGEQVHELEREAWNRMMELNAWSFVAVTQALLPSMLERQSGWVVAVTAKAAARGSAGMSAYIASKSALQRLVESMAGELGPRGINVNSVAPSVLDTPANRREMPNADPGGWVSLAVAATTIAFLVSDGARALHGQHLVLDA